MSERKSYSTVGGRRSGWSTEGGDEPAAHTSSLTCCWQKDGEGQ